MFKNQPAGLYVLALANTGERFGYYTMLAIFLFYLQAKFGFDATWTDRSSRFFWLSCISCPLSADGLPTNGAFQNAL